METMRGHEEFHDRFDGVASRHSPFVLPTISPSVFIVSAGSRAYKTFISLDEWEDLLWMFDSFRIQFSMLFRQDIDCDSTRSCDVYLDMVCACALLIWFVCA